jgi:hypothetical protein
VSAAPLVCILFAGLLRFDEICNTVYPGREFSRFSSATSDVYHDTWPTVTHETIVPLANPNLPTLHVVK